MPDNSSENSVKQDKSVKIEWNKISVRQWRELVHQSGKSNLLQSWPYAQAILITERLTGQFATISYEGRIVGICQVLEQRLLGLFHKVRLYRGPLWFEQSLPDYVYLAFWQEIRTRYPVRPWRFTYLLPELPDTVENRQLMETAGFKRIDTEGYSSIWLDLSQEEETLRANLKSNWRNPLNQSLKKGLTLEIDNEGEHLNWLLKLSETDKLLKEFRGPSPALVAHLKRFTKDREDMLLLRALDGGKAIGAVLIFLHEASATYLVGWNSPAGRDKRAHNFLIWHSIMELKKRQVNWLDLGGINPQDAAGVTTFKRGVGGEEFTLVGSYT